MDPARLVFPGFTIGKDDPKNAEKLARLGVGGFCLYRGTPKTVAALIRRLRRAAAHPLLICADYEEGAWAHVPGSTPLPTNLGIGASGSTEAARLKGFITAREARAMGVDWVLAPVVDLLSEPKNPIVNVRAFSAAPSETTRLARAYMAGLKAGGALGCLKHFPGHGATTADSHLDLPTVKVSRRLLEKRELVPFKALARTADAVMLGHLVVPALDASRLPLTLSGVGPALLRRWGMKGLIVTDALNMGAIAKHWGERSAALLALRCGTDILLVPQDPGRLVTDLRAEAAHDIVLARLCDHAQRRLERALSRMRPASASLSTVGGATHRRQAAKLFGACKTWVNPMRYSLSPSIAYFEPQKSKSGAVEGQAFLRALKRSGIRVRLADNGAARKKESLVAGVFVGPRAYSGRIRLPEPIRARMTAAMSAAPGGTVVSFGSPFVLSGLPRKTAGLCVYSRADAAQEAAATALREGK